MSSRYVLIVLAALLIGVGVLVGCKVGDGDISLAHVTGSRAEGDITVLTVQVEPGVHKRVFGPFAKYEGYASAEVRVDADTRILKQTTGGSEPATLDEVLAAKYLNVYFRQPATATEPIEATAEKVVVVERGHSGK